MAEEIKDLIVGTNLKAVELYTPAKMDVLLQGIKKKVNAVVLPDASTDKGRKEIIGLAYQVTQSKSLIEKGCLKVTEGWRQDTKTANESKKTAVEFLTKLANDTRQPVTDFEEAEKEQVKLAGQCLEYITNMRTVEVGTTSTAIMGKITTIDGYNYPDALSEEALETLQEEQEITLATLRNLHDQAVKAEEEQVELDQLRKEKKERDEKDLKEKEEKEAKEKAKAEEKERLEEEKKAEEEKTANEERVRKETEERVKKEAEEKAAREKRDREEKERLASEEAERKKKEEDAAEEKRKSNTLRRKNVQAAAVKSLMGNCDINLESATNIVSAIDDGLIDNITINY